MIYCAYMLFVYEHLKDNSEPSASFQHCMGLQCGLVELSRKSRERAPTVTNEEMLLMQILGLNALYGEYVKIRVDEDLPPNTRRDRMYQLLRSTSEISIDDLILKHPSFASVKILCLSYLFEMFSHHYVLQRTELDACNHDEIRFVKERLENILDKILISIPEAVNELHERDLEGPTCHATDPSPTAVADAVLLRACLRHSAFIVKYSLQSQLSSVQMKAAVDAATCLALSCSVLAKHSWAVNIDNTISNGLLLSALVLQSQSLNIVGILRFW